MGAILTQPWRGQPTVTAFLNQNQPWSPFLTEVAYPANRNALLGVTSYAMTTVPNPQGIGWRPTSTTSGGAVLTDLTRTADRTYLMVADFPASSATQQFFLDTNTGSRDIIVYTPGTGFQFFTEGGGAGLFNASGAFTPAGNVVIFRIKNGTQNAFSNGVSLGAGSAGTATASQKKLVLGSRFSSTLGLFEGSINLFASFSYYMPDSDVFELSRNPWQILDSSALDLIIPTAAVGGSFQPAWAYAANQTLIGGKIAS